MTTPSILLYDAMTACYAVSVLLYFIDYLNNSKSVNRVAFVLLSGVWILQTIFFVYRLRKLGYVPLFTTFEATVFFSWLLITLALIINYWLRMDLFAFFANVVGFGFLVFDMFTRKATPDVQLAGQGHLLIMHIAVAFLSYAAFSLSFIASVMYLVEESMLKKKRFTNSALRRFPALDRLDQWSFRLVAVGFPLLLVAMILGAVWYRISYGHVLLMDPKPVASVVLFIIYGMYFYVRVALGWFGQRMAWWNVGSFAFVAFNYFVIGALFRTFHHW